MTSNVSNIATGLWGHIFSGLEPTSYMRHSSIYSLVTAIYKESINQSWTTDAMKMIDEWETGGRTYGTHQQQYCCLTMLFAEKGSGLKCCGDIRKMMARARNNSQGWRRRDNRSFRSKPTDQWQPGKKGRQDALSEGPLLTSSVPLHLLHGMTAQCSCLLLTARVQSLGFQQKWWTDLSAW